MSCLKLVFLKLRLGTKKTRCHWKKIDAATESWIPGAEITVFNQASQQVSQTITGTDGTTSIEGLPIGTYTFRETLAPSGYVINPTTFSFTIASDGTITGEKELFNAKTKVTLTKIDKVSAAGLQGAEFTICDKNGKVVSKTTTGAMGTTTIEGLPIGTYTFKETVAPKGYHMIDKTFSFTINADETVTGDTVIRNERIKGAGTNPKTGVTTPESMWLAGSMALMLGGFGIIIKRKRSL